MRIAVLASGEGTTLQSIMDAASRGILDAQVMLVISNHRDCGALQRAMAAGIPTAHLSGVTHADPGELDQAVCAALARSGADVVVLAGYMEKIGPRTLQGFAGRILHTRGHAETGVSVHLVDADYDTGPVIAQTRVPVEPGMTGEQLEQAVQALERLFLCATLQRVARGQLALGARRR